MKTKGFKKFAAWLLTFAMLMPLMPGVTLSASAVSYASIYVGGVELADGEYLANDGTEATAIPPASGGYAHYADGVLTLSSYSYNGEGYMFDSEYNLTAAIYSETDLDIVLMGENSLTNTAVIGYGIYGDNSVDISGTETVLSISATEGTVVTFITELTVAENLAITSPDGTVDYFIGEGHDGYTIVDGEGNPVAEVHIAPNEDDTLSHTITYYANNDTDATDSVTVADGGEYTFAEDIFTYGSCEIEAWNTESDGSGDTYYVGDEVTVTEDITLYAQWVLPLNELESFTDDDLEWSGNTSSPYTFTMKNNAILYARVIFPAMSNEDKTTITVNGDCEIKGSLSFVSGTGFYGSSYKGDLTINGDGSLIVEKIASTGSGDSLTVYADTTINNEINIGASGGMDSCIVVEDATLTAPGVALLQYLTMEGKAKIRITNGRISFHSEPEINLGNKSEIYITGDGETCVLYKEGGAHESFDKLKKNNWLPAGYMFKDDGGYSLYDKNNNLETDSIIIKKTQSTRRPSSGGGGVTSCIVKFDSNGGSSVSNKIVTQNSKVTEPEAPKKEGYTFMGWFADEELKVVYDFNSKVTENITLYAKWEKVDDDNNGASGHNCPSRRFSDLDITLWYHPDTDYVIEKDIFRGTTETTFTPHGNITRAMMITVLYRAEGEPEVTGKTTFEDIDENAYYANAVVWGQQNGIINGYSEKEFAPEQEILREQIAAIMHRYAQYKGYDVSVGENTNILSYADFDNISEYAIPAMQWAVGSGMIKGRTESTLNPLDNATRVEIAAMLHRFIESNK